MESRGRADQGEYLQRRNESCARSFSLPSLILDVVALDVFQTFNQVGLAVKKVTGGSQQPWVSNSPIEGDFYFAGK
jgi:hypothetical protein